MKRFDVKFEENHPQINKETKEHKFLLCSICAMNNQKTIRFNRELTCMYDPVALRLFEAMIGFQSGD